MMNVNTMMNSETIIDTQTYPNTHMKVVMIGDGGVGKTTYINRLLTGDFNKRYIATVGATSNLISFNTTKGRITFDVVDTAGQEILNASQLQYFKDADACFIMFDATSKTTMKSIPDWYSKFKNVSNAQIIILGNKCDSSNIKLTFNKMRNLCVRYGTYFTISSKSNYNYLAPFLQLIKQKLGEDTEITNDE